MTRRRTILLATAGILLLATTYLESSIRYHYDTLRTERRMRLRLLGIPIPLSQREYEDPYPEIYQQITGRIPDPQRWRQMPADFVCFLWGSQNFCHGSGIFRDRGELLAAVYKKFRTGGSQTEAAAHIARIDLLLPMPWNPRQQIDLMAVHTLRKELGLESAFDHETPANL
jgi:hypothetical protein